MKANLVILSMAWLTREDARSYSRVPRDPDMETLSYWLARLEPVIRAGAKEEIIVVLANRCGVEDEAVYAGTSVVLGIHLGEVKVYGILGRGEEELLVVDTSNSPQAKILCEPTSAASTAAAVIAGSDLSATSPTTASTSTGFDDDDFAPPVSPLDAKFQEAFDTKRFIFSDENPHTSLQSSIVHGGDSTPLPDSPEYRRPEAPSPET